MSKYFNEDGSLKSIYMEKIQPLLDEVDRKHDQEIELILQTMPDKKRAYENAKLDFIAAKKNLEKTYGEFMAGDSSFGLIASRDKQKRRIMESCLKTFSDLQDQLDEKDGTAVKRQQIAQNLLRMNLQAENPFLEKPLNVRRVKTLRESIKEDEEGNQD
jgi:hypothetical protein